VERSTIGMVRLHSLAAAQSRMLFCASRVPPTSFGRSVFARPAEAIPKPGLHCKKVTIAACCPVREKDI
jgi:hypothetical protein